jgi:phage/plasmid primase-like uncharacterized protein
MGKSKEGRMTSFVDFCRLHGVLMDQLPAIGTWQRFRTEDKPKHRNGAVKFMGDHGFCQNHASMQEVAVWRAEGFSEIARQEIRLIAKRANDEIMQGQRRAAQRAEEILRACRTGRHAYMASKGFPEEAVNVWKTDKGDLMVVPMRVGRDLVGCQTITEDGEKKFLFGQRCSHAEYVFTAGKGPHIVCEGYATSLSIRLAMTRLKRPYALHVTFSAGNMKKVAAALPVGIVIADNDTSKTGERTAQEIGWPYWISDRVDEDGNDYHQRMGLFPLSQGITRALMEVRKRA